MPRRRDIPCKIDEQRSSNTCFSFSCGIMENGENERDDRDFEASYES